jgi:hypothetical protein
MTANSTAQAEMRAGAASHETVDWHAIDWQEVHHTVRRLQARIVKAVQAGKWGKAKALQRLLTHLSIFARKCTTHMRLRCATLKASVRRN